MDLNREYYDDMPPINPDDVQPDPLTPPNGFGQPVDLMTDRQLLEEIVYQQRSMATLIGEFQAYVANMKPGDILKMFLGGSGKKLGG